MIGKRTKLNNGLDVSEEYYKLAMEDEETAHLLQENKKYRQASYLYIQAIEKYIRSKIFTVANSEIDHFRKENSNHKFVKAVEMLAGTKTTDPVYKQQLIDQINKFVFKGVNLEHLHNNTRYPFFKIHQKKYYSNEYNSEDCKTIEQILNDLKRYLKEMDKY